MAQMKQRFPQDIDYTVSLDQTLPVTEGCLLYTSNPDKRVFVHCHAGVDRTGMAIASYRMAKEGWSPDEAMKEMQLFGFGGFHHLRLPTLVRFEKDFPEHLKTSSAFQDLQVVKR